MSKPINVLFLVGGTPGRGLSPSSRFRVYAYSRLFSQDRRFRVRIRSSIPSTAFHERPFIKRHRWLARILVPAGLMLMIAVRLTDVLRAAFYEVIVIQKPLLPGKLFPFLELLISLVNPRILFDFDDARFVYHERTSPERRNWLYRKFEDPTNMERIISRAAHVTPGNSYLANFALRYNKNVTIVPTPIDVDQFVPHEETAITENRPASRPIVIGWIGTSGNLRYVEALAQVFKEIQENHDIELCIVCNPITRSLALDGVKWRWVDWALESELAELYKFSIGIMPLDDSSWERGKCGFKLLQYMACGIPVIGSPVGVNLAIIRDGENGFLADSPEAWKTRLVRLIGDKELRRKFAAGGRSTVVANYALDKTYPLLADSIIAVAKGGGHSAAAERARST